MAEGVTVRVRFASIYLSPTWRALPESRAGDIITIAGGTYAQDMLARGFVEPVDPSSPALPIDSTGTDHPEPSSEHTESPASDESTTSPVSRGRRASLR